MSDTSIEVNYNNPKRRYTRRCMSCGDCFRTGSQGRINCTSCKPHKPHNSKADWTPDRCAKLAQLWAEGKSAALCANILGGMSRSAVIGKAHRLLLPSRKKAATVPRPKRSIRPRMPQDKFAHFTADQANVFGRSKKKVFVSEALPQSVADEFIPTFQRKQLLELEPDMCRWPVGNPREPGFFFCGAHKASPLPYCDCHTRRAYQKDSARQDLLRLAA